MGVDVSSPSKFQPGECGLLCASQLHGRPQGALVRGAYTVYNVRRCQFRPLGAPWVRLHLEASLYSSWMTLCDGVMPSLHVADDVQFLHSHECFAASLCDWMPQMC